MSEQRFICGMGFTNADVNFYNPIRIIHDNENDKDYYLFADICKIMNEQQATIQEQDKRINELERMLKKCDAERIRLQNERGAIIKFGVRGGSV